MTIRQYSRLGPDWISGIGLDPHLFGTHSLRRTNATLIYSRTGNLLESSRKPQFADILQNPPKRGLGRDALGSIRVQKRQPKRMFV